MKLSFSKVFQTLAFRHQTDALYMARAARIDVLG